MTDLCDLYIECSLGLLEVTAKRFNLKDKYKVKRVYLIGSLITGFIHQRSDIDLVVEGLPTELYMKALTELWDLLPMNVELNLIPFEDAFESLKEKALKDGELVYG